MKLIKQYAGEYRGEETIEGFEVILEVSSMQNRGFSFSYYVNGRLMYDDGWYGLRLSDIKQSIERNVKSVIEEYKAMVQ